MSRSRTPNPARPVFFGFRSGTTFARGIFFVVAGEIALALVLSAPGRASEPGSPALEREPANLPVATRGADDTSLFSGAFWAAGIDQDAAEPVEEEGERAADDDEIREPVDEDNPLNPTTGQPFTNRQMARFEELTRQFPGNTLVPRKRAGVRAAMRAEAEIIGLERAAERRQASAAQILAVYRFYIEREEANIRLLEYLKHYAETDAQRARHAWLQKRSRAAIEQRREQRERFENPPG